MKVSRLNERAFEQREARGTPNPSGHCHPADHSATHSPVPLRTRRRVRLLVVVPGPVSRRAWSGRWSLEGTIRPSGPRRAASAVALKRQTARTGRPERASEAAREPGSDALKASGPALRKNRFQTTPASRGLPGAPIFFITRGVDAPAPGRPARATRNRGAATCATYMIFIVAHSRLSRRAYIHLYIPIAHRSIGSHPAIRVSGLLPPRPPPRPSVTFYPAGPVGAWSIALNIAVNSCELLKNAALCVHPCPVTNASKSCSVPPACATRVSRRALRAASSSAEGGGAT